MSRSWAAVCAAALLALTAPHLPAQGAPAAEVRFELGLLPPLGGKPEEAAISGFALRRIAEIQGIPFRTLGSPDEMARYPLVVMVEAPSNRVLDAAWREALYRYVEEGGILFVPGLPGSDLYPLLGIREILSSQSRTRLAFEGGDPALSYIDHPRERVISLGNGERRVYPEVIWSHGVRSDASGQVLARFEDGAAGMLRNDYGRGAAYFLGLSLEESVLLPQTGGDFEAQRSFVNSVEPSADVIMLIIKALYEEYVPRAVYLSPIPRARPTALLLTHDVDAQTSFVDSLKFAALEESFGVRGTYFINTKYFEDRMDIAYYSVPENRKALEELAARGHEIGSHTVAHALEFDKAPPGDPRVRFETYAPLRQITINGEVRVSKQLLDEELPGRTTASFRAGYLAFPPELIGILESAGYRCDSSFSANDVLTTFPYFALPERKPGPAASRIVEIPVTLDDAVGGLTPGNRESALRQWEEVVKAHAGNETITVLLIHPSDTRDRTYKLDAQRELMEYAAGLGAWMGPLGEFGEFWRARQAVHVTEARTVGRTLEIRLSLPRESLHPWIGLAVPGASRYDGVHVLDSAGTLLPFTGRRAGGKLYLYRTDP